MTKEELKNLYDKWQDAISRLATAKQDNLNFEADLAGREAAKLAKHYDQAADNYVQDIVHPRTFPIRFE